MDCREQLEQVEVEKLHLEAVEVKQCKRQPLISKRKGVDLLDMQINRSMRKEVKQ